MNIKTTSCIDFLFILPKAIQKLFLSNLDFTKSLIDNIGF